MSKGMPISNPELKMLIDEIKVIERFGLAGFEMPYEKIEMWNMIMDYREANRNV